ncbi:hypothetical protein [Pontibacter qinzhouensis]|nr:hypothetical protein [Pontibacter qinzhouensis]
MSLVVAELKVMVGIRVVTEEVIGRFTKHLPALESLGSFNQKMLLKGVFI